MGRRAAGRGGNRGSAAGRCTGKGICSRRGHAVSGGGEISLFAEVEHWDLGWVIACGAVGSAALGNSR